MLKKIVIKNYRIFKNFELEFNTGANILVGDNDAGKSTILEAVNLALTGRLRGRQLAYELSPYLFNLQSTAEYVAALADGSLPDPPEFVIDLFMDEHQSSALLRGTNNCLLEDEVGIRIRAHLDPAFAEEYQHFIASPEEVKLVPTEYYIVQWVGFSGNAVTGRSIPAFASLIDASSIRLTSGADYYMQEILKNHLEDNERVELARSYRSLREQFADNPSVQTVNTRLLESQGSVTDRELSLAIDISQKFTWESSLTPHLDDLPLQFVGRGEQNTLKVLLALERRLTDSHVVLIEEPENHLSFSTLNMLTRKIDEKCSDKQVLLTTHSSYVLNKLGISNLILLSQVGGVRLSDLPDTTQDYFKKLSGYDTLRIVLARRAILVEGPSDELVVQRAYLDVHGRLPIHDGVDVINVRGLSFARFLDIASRLGTPTRVVTDNDGKQPDEVRARYSSYTSSAEISVHVGEDPSLLTLEPQLLAANDRQKMNSILGTSHATDEELLTYMADNKTSVALAVFEATEVVSMPGYIDAAVQ